MEISASKEKNMEYLSKIFENAIKEGEKSIILTSREVHKAIGYTNRYPSVCNSMRSIGNEKKYNILSWEILEAPPKGDGATLKIKYNFNINERQTKNIPEKKDSKKGIWKLLDYFKKMIMG